MKYIALLATMVSSVALPVTAAHATATAGVSKQSICIPVIVETPDGPADGVLCYVQGGQV